MTADYEWWRAPHEQPGGSSAAPDVAAIEEPEPAPAVRRKELCAACRFFVPHTDDSLSLGLCHRYAPRPMTGRREGDTLWPTVGSGDWCGEFA